MLKPTTKAIYVLLASLLLFFQYKIWCASDGLIRVWHLKKELRTKIEQNQQLMQQNKDLINDIQDLKKGGAAIEEHARNDLGMIKQGEIFYRPIFSQQDKK